MTDLQQYLALNTQIFSLKLAKKFIFYLARTSSGLLEECITITTARGYIASTLSAICCKTGKYQLDCDEREQVFIYILDLEQNKELSDKERVKVVA